MMKPTYVVQPSSLEPEPGSWRGSYWRSFSDLKVNHYREESSNHRPEVQAKATYTADHLHLLFEVHDQFVRAAHTAYQSMVCQDSCVEFFVRPKPAGGYLNFEVNCCGVLHCSYIEDWTRVDGGFACWTPVPGELVSGVTIDAELTGPITDEIGEPLTWHVVLSVPFSLLAHYVGELGDITTQQWAANFYKCGDHTSHPHWAAWSPVKHLNFHAPDCFGHLNFQ